MRVVGKFFLLVRISSYNFMVHLYGCMHMRMYMYMRTTITDCLRNLSTTRVHTIQFHCSYHSACMLYREELHVNNTSLSSFYTSYMAHDVHCMYTN